MAASMCQDSQGPRKEMHRALPDYLHSCPIPHIEIKIARKVRESNEILTGRFCGSLGNEQPMAVVSKQTQHRPEGQSGRARNTHDPGHGCGRMERRCGNSRRSLSSRSR